MRKTETMAVLENNSVYHEAAGNLSFLLSVIRCGEKLSAEEEANVRRVIERLGKAERAREYSTSVTLGPAVFSFKSQADWVAHGTRRFIENGYLGREIVCVDSHGLVCAWGKHFRIADETAGYPITAYVIREDEVKPKIVEGAHHA